MPISRENRPRYPKDWPEISIRIRSERAKWVCETPDCGAVDGRPHPITGAIVVLTVGHLNHQPEDNREENLRASAATWPGIAPTTSSADARTGGSVTFWMRYLPAGNSTAVADEPHDPDRCPYCVARAFGRSADAADVRRLRAVFKEATKDAPVKIATTAAFLADVLEEVSRQAPHPPTMREAVKVMADAFGGSDALLEPDEGLVH